jgi:hypothetical protein
MGWDRMSAINDWPIQVKVIPDEEAKRLGHDSVPPPNKDQRANWIRQLEDEAEDRLPFEDDES